MNGEMNVAVMEGIGKMGYTKRPIPTPKANEVLVKLEYVGICGSDMHYYESGAIGDYVVKPPFVLGHEFPTLKVQPCYVGLFFPVIPQQQYLFGPFLANLSCPL